MRFGKSKDPELDINHQLGLFMDLSNTRPKTYCMGLGLQGKKCLTCPPLFPKFVRSPDGTLTLAQTTGLTFTSGDGVDDASMVVRGGGVNRVAAGLTVRSGVAGSEALTVL